jgi:hypothetical protein
MSENETCPSCGGVGQRLINGKWETCVRCGGSGTIPAAGPRRELQRRGVIVEERSASEEHGNSFANGMALSASMRLNWELQMEFIARTTIYDLDGS